MCKERVFANLFSQTPKYVSTHHLYLNVLIRLKLTEKREDYVRLFFGI